MNKAIVNSLVIHLRNLTQEEMDGVARRLVGSDDSQAERFKNSISFAQQDFYEMEHERAIVQAYEYEHSRELEAFDNLIR